VLVIVVRGVEGKVRERDGLEWPYGEVTVPLVA